VAARAALDRRHRPRLAGRGLTRRRSRDSDGSSRTSDTRDHQGRRTRDAPGGACGGSGFEGARSTRRRAPHRTRSRGRRHEFAAAGSWNPELVRDAHEALQVRTGVG
jgi:hypothetical protein